MFISSAILALISTLAVAQAEDVCGGPTYNLEGYGVGTTGGSGPDVVVTTCESLKKAAKSGGNIKISGWLHKCGIIDVASNTTIMKSVSGSSGLYDTSLRLLDVTNVIIRNVPFQHSHVDTSAILLDGATYIWLDHLEFVGVCPSAKGSWITVKPNSDLVTVSWSVISDSCGGVEVEGDFQGSKGPHITLHHNFWFFVERGIPALGSGVAHIYSNCADAVSGSGISLRGRATALVESNQFYAVKQAISTAEESSATERNNRYFDSPINITKEGHIEPPYEYT